MTWRKKTRAWVVDFPARANWWVSSLSQTCLKRESSVSPSMTFAIWGVREIGRRSCSTTLGGEHFWYRDNFGLLKKHRDVKQKSPLLFISHFRSLSILSSLSFAGLPPTFSFSLSFSCSIFQICGHDNLSKLNTLDNTDTETISAFRFRLY